MMAKLAKRSQEIDNHLVAWAVCYAEILPFLLIGGSESSLGVERMLSSIWDTRFGNAFRDHEKIGLSGCPISPHQPDDNVQCFLFRHLPFSIHPESCILHVITAQ